MRWIWSAAQLRKVGHVYGGNARRNQLGPIVEDVRVIDTEETRALGDSLGAIQEIGGVNWDVYVVLNAAHQELIYLCWADRPYVINRVGLIGTVEDFWRFVGAAIQRLVLEKRKVHATEPNLLSVRDVPVDSGRILSLVLW